MEAAKGDEPCSEGLTRCHEISKSANTCLIYQPKVFNNSSTRSQTFAIQKHRRPCRGVGYASLEELSRGEGRGLGK